LHIRGRSQKGAEDGLVKKKICLFGNKEAKSAGVTLCINVNIDREPVDVKSILIYVFLKIIRIVVL